MSQTQPDTANRVPLSRTLGATVMKAKEYARHQGHRHITLEHLLLALVEDHDASIVLASCNVDRNRVGTDVSGYLGRLEDRAQPGETVDPVPHTDLVRIIEYATAAARQSRRREINGAIVLAAIVGEGRSTAAGILRVQGLTFEEAIKALQRASAGNKPQPQVAAEQAAQPAIPPPPAPVAETLPAPSRAAPQTTEQILAGARERIEASRQQTAPPAPPAPARMPAAQPGPPPSPPAAAPVPEFETSAAAPATPAPPPSAPPPVARPASEAASPPERAITAPPQDHAAARPAPPPAPRPASPPPAQPAPAAAAAAAAAAPPPPGPPPGWPAEPPGHGQPRPMPPAAARLPLPPSQPGPGTAPPSPAAGPPAAPPQPSPAPSLRDFERSEPTAAPPQPQPVPSPELSQRTGPPPLSPGWAPPSQQPPPAPQPLPPRAREDSAPPRVPRPAAASGGQTPQPQAYGHQHPEPPTGAPTAPRHPSPPPWQPATDARARPLDPLAQPPSPPTPTGGPRPMPSAGQPRPPGPPPAGPAPSRSTPATGSIPGLADGQLVEKIPRKMRVGIPETVEIRIAKADVQNLSVGIEGRGAPMRHDLIVTRAMSVRLRAPDGGFAIDPASPETQWIENRLGLMSDDYASWRWTVTPLRRGPARLQLVVAAKTVGTDGLAADTALPDQVIEISISTNYRQSAVKWGGWAAAAVIGGLLSRFGETIVSLGSSFIGR